MRAAVTLALGAAVLVLVGAVMVQSVSGQPPPRQRVSVALTTVAVRYSFDTRVNVNLLWNRDERTAPIGHSINSCLKVQGGGLLGGGGLHACTLTVVLPLGKVTASGIIHTFRRYTLVITGGTGAYERAVGPLFVRSVTGDGVRRMTFFITP